MGELECLLAKLPVKQGTAVHRTAGPTFQLQLGLLLQASPFLEHSLHSLSSNIPFALVNGGGLAPGPLLGSLALSCCAGKESAPLREAASQLHSWVTRRHFCEKTNQKKESKLGHQ